MSMVVLYNLANSANTDQTAPKEQSDLSLHCLVVIHLSKDFG